MKKILLSIAAAVVVVFSAASGLCADSLFEPMYIFGDSSSVWDIEADKLGNVYASHSVHGVVKYVDGTWVVLNPVSQSNISIDESGTLWALNMLTGIIGRYKDDIWSYYNYPEESFHLRKIDAVSDSCVWALTGGYGFYRLNVAAGTDTLFTMNDGLPSNGGHLIEATHEGHVWISHSAVCMDNCTYLGVSHYNGDSWETYTETSGLLHQEVISIRPVSANEAYISFPNGIVRYNGDTLIPYDVGDTEALACGTDGALWSVTWIDNTSVYKKYHNDEVTVYDRFKTYRGWGDPRVWEIVVDTDDNVWTLMTDSKLYRTKTQKIVSVDEPPIQSSLHLNAYPNPANPATTIMYRIGESKRITLDVYSITGQKVATLVDGVMNAGVHTARFNGSAFGSGIYFYRFAADGDVKTGRFTVLK